MLPEPNQQYQLSRESNQDAMTNAPLPNSNPNAPNSSYYLNAFLSHTDKGKTHMLNSPTNHKRKGVRENEEDELIWNTRREEALSGNLSLEEVMRVNLSTNRWFRKKLEERSSLWNLPFAAMWRSISSSQTSDYLKSRGKFPTSHAKINLPRKSTKQRQH